MQKNYCEIDLDKAKRDAFVYAIKNHYWYQMYIDDLPIWGKWYCCILKTTSIFCLCLDWWSITKVCSSAHIFCQCAMLISEKPNQILLMTGAVYLSHDFALSNMDFIHYIKIYGKLNNSPSVFAKKTGKVSCIGWLALIKEPAYLNVCQVLVCMYGWLMYCRIVQLEDNERDSCSLAVSAGTYIIHIITLSKSVIQTFSIWSL